MRITLPIFIIILAIATTAQTADKKDAPKVKRVDNLIAVFDFDVTPPIDKKISRPLSDSIKREIVKAGKYEVMERSAMDKVLNEQAFQLSGCVAKECAVEAGQMLGVGKVIVGSVSQVGKTYLLALSLVNVATGKVEAAEDQECKCEIDELIQMSKKASNALMGQAYVAQTTTVGSSVNNRFVVTDTTITDTKTNLIWLRDAGHSAKIIKDEYIWRKNALDYLGQLNKQKIAGYTDWRLPSANEFDEWEQYAKDMGMQKEKIANILQDVIGFINVRSGAYYSSRMNRNGALAFWECGNPVWPEGAPGDQVDMFYVWPVRGKQLLLRERETERLVIFKHTLLDKKTGYTWTKLAGVLDKQIGLGEARRFLSELNIMKYEGCDDWDFPLDAEISDMVRQAKRIPIDTHDASSYYYLSKKTWGAKGKEALRIDTVTGALLYPPDGDHYLWPVCKLHKGGI